MRLGIYPEMGLAKAREAWRAARHEVLLGRDPSQKPESGATDFVGVFHEWLRRDQAQNRSHDDVKHLIEKNALPAWNGRRIADIGRRHVLDVAPPSTTHRRYQYPISMIAMRACL